MRVAWHRWGAGALLAAALLLALAAPAAAQEDPGTTAEAEAQLIERYAPVIAVRIADGDCDTDGELYGPVPVEAVLGNPDVRLLRPKDGDHPEEVLTAGPTSRDIATLGRDFALDLPGYGLSPGCTYARDLAARVARASLRPTVYAHVAREPGVAGLAVQYWIYWYFNEFNNLHESDWEMVQVAFDGSSAEEALASEPSRVAYAQHSGGEVADWGASKIDTEGTHPVVYAAAGSHASYFGSALYLGTGENGAGLGCDDTREPLRRIHPGVVTVETDPDPAGPHGWLTFEGVWGEHQGGFNGPPDGPARKRQWREPFRWMAGLREDNPEVPGAQTIGPNVSATFCGVVEAVSDFAILAAQSRGTALVVLGLLVIGVGAPLRRTRWSPVVSEPLRQERAVGQIVGTTAQVRRSERRTFRALGLLVIPAMLAAAGLQALVLDLFGVGGWLEERSAGGLGGLFAILLGLAGAGVGFTMCSVAVTSALVLLHQRRPVSVRAAIENLGARRALSTTAATLGVGALCVVIAFTVIGIPIALWLAVRWLFIQDGILFRGLGVRDALRWSATIVHGHWWRTFGCAFLLAGIAIATGPLVGIALIFFTGLPLGLVNIFGSIVFALAVPWLVIARFLLYLDLEERFGVDAPPAPAEAGTPGP